MVGDKPIYLLITWMFPTPTNWRGAFAYDFVKAMEKALTRGRRQAGQSAELFML